MVVPVLGLEGRQRWVVVFAGRFAGVLQTSSQGGGGRSGGVGGIIASGIGGTDCSGGCGGDGSARLRGYAAHRSGVVRPVSIVQTAIVTVAAVPPPEMCKVELHNEVGRDNLTRYEFDIRFEEDTYASSSSVWAR